MKKEAKIEGPSGGYGASPVAQQVPAVGGEVKTNFKNNNVELIFPRFVPVPMGQRVPLVNQAQMGSPEQMEKPAKMDNPARMRHRDNSQERRIIASRVNHPQLDQPAKLGQRDRQEKPEQMGKVDSREQGQHKANQGHQVIWLSLLTVWKLAFIHRTKRESGSSWRGRKARRSGHP
jgi:hypothetical protein